MSLGKQSVYFFYFKILLWVIAGNIALEPQVTGPVPSLEFAVKPITGSLQPYRSTADHDVSVDYFWGPPLRAKELACTNKVFQIICFNKCGNNYVCNDNKCMCLNPIGHNNVRTIEEESTEEEISERPALRHHIAHFCPDLEEARKCIRGCMKLGKPAFCGKDHVCYCGHRYTSHDEEKQLNLDDMYAEFRDLYEKYFGPQSGES